MALVTCKNCQRPDSKSFYRGYRLAEDRCVSCNGRLRRFKHGQDRYWEKEECTQCWPPIKGTNKTLGQSHVWRSSSFGMCGDPRNTSTYADRMDWECPQCHFKWSTWENYVTEEIQK